jgi:hypothetical protein
MNNQDEFYVGWQARGQAGIGSYVRKIILAVFILVLSAACLLPLAQGTIGSAAFEWGTIKTFTGILQTQPYPHLLVPRPGQGGGQSAYYLVAPFKFGLDHEAIAKFEGKPVTLKGTLIYRGTQTMIEARPESIQLASGSDRQIPSLQYSNTPSLQAAATGTLKGEIVDSKCYLGVMNPGNLTPHRGCAVRCISGGIPPILLVRQENGPPLYFLLVASDGSPVNKQVLDMVAEPVEITGNVVRQGELSILRADPSTYRRVVK